MLLSNLAGFVVMAVIFFGANGPRLSVLAKLIQFEEFSLDCDGYELLRDDRPVKLEKIPLELLIPARHQKLLRTLLEGCD